MTALLTDTQEAATRGARRPEATAARPRVLHLINSFEIGGTERQAVELIKRLDASRFDVRLAALRPEGPLLQEVAAQFPVVPAFPLKSFYDANAVKQLLRLRSWMVRERIDILHAHDFYAGLIGAAAARLAGVRVIACQRHLKLSDRAVHEWGARVIHYLAHRILVNSEAIHDSITRRSSTHTGKVRVIKNGITPLEGGAGPDALRRELGLESDARLVGTVARLQPVKGHRCLIEAAAQVLDHYPKVYFILVGDGPLRAEIEAQVRRLGIGDRVRLLGDRLDAARLTVSFDLFVLASLHEGLPNAVMEAMAAGVPVVATAVGGTQELIIDGETGYLVPAAEAGALARAIRLALEDEDHRARVAAQGQRFIKAEFGMQRMVGAVEGLYDELMIESA